MRLLFLALILGSQAFAANPSNEMTGDQLPSHADIHPDALELAVDKVLDAFPKESQPTIKPGAEEALSKINPAHTKELLNLSVKTLHEHNAPISSSFVEGVIAGVNAGLNSVENKPGVAQPIEQNTIPTHIEQAVQNNQAIEVPREDSHEHEGYQDADQPVNHQAPVVSEQPHNVIHPQAQPDHGQRVEIQQAVPQKRRNSTPKRPRKNKQPPAMEKAPINPPITSQ